MSHGIALPKISVVVPIYQGRAKLNLCVNSLRGQLLPFCPEQWELLLVFNNRTEYETRAQEFEAQAETLNPRIRVLLETKIGSYAARNRGILAAHGQIIAFTDSDCQPESNWLHAGIEALGNAEHPVVVAGAIEIVPLTSSQNWIERHELCYSLNQQEFVSRYGFGATANLLVPKSVFEKVGLFDDRFLSGGDWDFGIRLRRAGVQIQYEPKAKVLHPACRSLSTILRRTRRYAGGHHALRQKWGSEIIQFADTQKQRSSQVPQSLSIRLCDKICRTARSFEDWRCHMGFTPIR